MQGQDPDNEHRALLNTPNTFYRDYTNNYVIYQRGYPAYQHPEFPNANVVCAVGKYDYNSFVCTGAIHPNAIARHASVGIYLYDQISDSIWLSYGGNDMKNTEQYASRMYFGDESMYVGFDVGSLAPGDVATFTTVEAMTPTELDKSLAIVGAMSIVQPTDLLTGRSVPYTIGE